MKLDKNEAAALESAARACEVQMVELAEFQLALVGGGIGDVVWG